MKPVEEGLLERDARRNLRRDYVSGVELVTVGIKLTVKKRAVNTIRETMRLRVGFMTLIGSAARRVGIVGATLGSETAAADSSASIVTRNRRRG